MKKVVLLLFLTVFMGLSACNIEQKNDGSSAAVQTSEEAADLSEIDSTEEQQSNSTDQDIVNVTEELQENEEGELSIEPSVDTSPDQNLEPITQHKIFLPQLKYSDAYNGPLYATSEQVGPAPMDVFFENLDRNGINYFIGMFTVEGEPTTDVLASDSGLGLIIDSVQRHPYRVIPFFNPGLGGKEIEEEGVLHTHLYDWYHDTLLSSKKLVGDDFIRGFGEVETQEWSVPHDHQKIRELVTLAEEHDINFMFHPVASKVDDVAVLAEMYPNTIFLFHMFREDLAKSQKDVIALLKRYDNVYFSMDAAHIIFDDGDVIYEYAGGSKSVSISRFVSFYDNNEEAVVASAVSAYKPLVEAAPEKVMWGTEIGPEYAFDPRVFDRAIKASRLVIGAFDSDYQEAVGYKNALRVFGEGVTIGDDIAVINTRSWPDCTSSIMDDCDDTCDTPDADFLTAEQNRCFSLCLIENQCNDVPESDHE